MGEKRLVIDQLKLTYEGLLDVNGLIRTIDSWLYEKGYDKWDAKNYEQDLPTGKEVDMELLPWKKITDYFENMFKIRLRISNVKDVEIEHNGVKRIVQKGKLMMIFDAYQHSDYEGMWESKPIFFFFRTLFDKFVFKKTVAYYERWLVNDLYDLHSRIQRFLNIYRYEKRIG